ncbi:MAG: hypothetical protein IJ465_01270 [Clostridia bacterium]|nr:hypothetical protein [Clostridia bacterium]
MKRLLALLLVMVLLSGCSSQPDAPPTLFNTTGRSSAVTSSTATTTTATTTTTTEEIADTSHNTDESVSGTTTITTTSASASKKPTTTTTTKQQTATTTTTTTQKATTTSAAIVPPESSTEAFCQEVWRLTNAEREKAGLPPLNYHSELQQLADTRAAEIDYYSGHFSHTRPDGSEWHTVFGNGHIDYRAIGENIAFGQQTPAEVVQAWMDSPGHRANILNEDFTGIICGFNDYHWVQLFLTPWE